MDISTVATGLQFPEGPIAMRDGTIILVEIQRQTLSRVHPDGRVEVIAELGGGPNGAAIGPDGHVYVCNNGGFVWGEREGSTIPIGTPDEYTSGSIQRVNLSTGAVETLYTSCNDIPLRGPNDIVFDTEGGFYFTDLGKTMRDYLHHGSVFYAKTDGSYITRVFGPMLTPNGVGLSPDGRQLHVAETRTARVWAFDITGPGQIERPTGFVPGRLLVTLPGYQMLDSLAIQGDGGVCVATLVRGGISIVSPKTGDVEFIQFPDDPYITNICFGGADLRDAWVTGSGKGSLFHCRWPTPGLELNFNA
ncbi:SMP-30/gluconolactonase/LRE family protein [Pseudooceanicola sp.]|uniref:SMP-30/gluconolactonase/LRE family protein n=1 Tax=Pseudooceanicola sp. TaxID=1914328 RepID=UPI002632B4D9|nr:SMP-30/gluconolactonase/LRE family protein [Pseudooceanicola sp.]MDF1856583.1 SMP-30/gluconolactonase/LRE family protein [Pseudooceanicola sp.]